MPVRPFVIRAGDVLRLGFEPQILQIHQHDVCRAGTQKGQKGPDDPLRVGIGQPAMLPQAIVNGLLFGSVYATIGIGFSLVWGVMNIINVAHGSFIMIGAYLSYTLFALYGLDPFLAIPPVMAVLFLLAYVLARAEFALKAIAIGEGGGEAGDGVVHRALIGRS